MLIKQRTLPVL